MRMSHLLLTFSACAALGAGCSSSSSPPNNSVTDAASEAATTTDAAAETSTIEDTGAPACVPDSSLLAYNPSDVSLGGTATVSGCFDCVKTMCTTTFSACSADCGCNAGISGLYTCLGSGASPYSCLQTLLKITTDSALTKLTGCTVESCAVDCPLTGAGAGDGGTPDASGDTGTSTTTDASDAASE
jgi:hypothetical protein